MRALLHECSLRKIDAFFSPMAWCSGVLLLYRQRWYCIINSKRSFVHQRFTLAHELYHFDFHRHLSLVFTDHYLYSTDIEREANRGAAEMLMPADLVRTYVKTIARKYPYVDPVCFLAKEFKVSRQAMEIRLKELRIVKREEKK